MILKNNYKNMLMISKRNLRMKEVMSDTETTGISVKDGHRIVEIGCLEIDDLIQPKTFHCYLNPEKKYQKKLWRFMVTMMNFFPQKNLRKYQMNF